MAIRKAKASKTRHITKRLQTKRRQLRKAFRAKPTTKSLKAKLTELWGVYVKMRDKTKHGPLCRICGRRPGAVAYHLVPKQRGNAVRWLLENGVLACSPCNYAEHMNRSLYRDKHVALFGKEFIESIEIKARTVVKYSAPDLLAMIQGIRGRIESGRLDNEAISMDADGEKNKIKFTRRWEHKHPTD